MQAHNTHAVTPLMLRSCCPLIPSSLSLSLPHTITITITQVPPAYLLRHIISLDQHLFPPRPPTRPAGPLQNECVGPVLFRWMQESGASRGLKDDDRLAVLIPMLVDFEPTNHDRMHGYTRWWDVEVSHLLLNARREGRAMQEQEARGRKRRRGQAAGGTSDGGSEEDGSVLDHDGAWGGGGSEEEEEEEED
jgi:hypothetical protein